jgi:hypothetical protein
VIVGEGPDGIVGGGVSARLHSLGDSAFPHRFKFPMRAARAGIVVRFKWRRLRHFIDAIADFEIILAIG